MGAPRRSARDQAPRHGAEERVADCEPAEKEPQGRRSGLAMGTKQGGQKLLPRNLVHQAAEARQQSQHEGEGALHRRCVAGFSV
jgi:hypothetical protein